MPRILGATLPRTALPVGRHAIHARPEELLVPIEQRAGTALLRLAGVFLLFVGVVGVVAPRDPNIYYSRWRVLLFLVVLALGAAATVALARRSRRPPSSRRLRLVSVGVTVAGSAVCTLLAWALRYDTQWDAGGVAAMSQWLVDGHDPKPRMYGYLSQYPNNLPLLVVDNLCGEIGKLLHLAPGTVSVALNGLALAVTMQATYWLVAMLRGPAHGLVAQVLVLALMGTSPWMAVAYTDLVAMPLVALGTALTVAAPRARPGWPRALCAASAVGCLLLAYEVKTTPVVSVVAVVLVVALAWRSTSVRVRRRLAVGTVAGLVLFAGGAVLARQLTPAVAGVSAERIDRTRTPPTVWWVYMAVSTHTKDGLVRYGAYSEDIVRETRGMHREAAGRYAAAGLERRLSELGVTGVAGFLADKAAWNWGDGMFWAWGEGDDEHAAPLVHGPLTDNVRSWNHLGGAAYATRAALAEALWLLLLLATGLRLLRAPWRWETGLLALSVLGIAAFTLVFQGRSRYLIPYVPVVVALATTLSVVVWRPRGRTTPTAGHAEPATVGPGA